MKRDPCPRRVRDAAIAALIAAMLHPWTAVRTGAQETPSRPDPIRGTVTYVSGDVIYISPGSAAGVADSAGVVVLSGRDTIATLRVFAVSTKSAACRITTSKRRPRSGDAAIITSLPALPAKPVATPAAPAPTFPAGGDSLGGPRESRAAVSSGARPLASSGLRLRGRISAQYQTFLMDSTFAAVTRPGLSVFLRGDAPGSRLRFEFAGALRSTVTGTSGPFAANGVNSSRIYRLFVEYDDSLNRFGAGRLVPSPGLPSGYVDGLFAARRFGIVEFGAAAGFEPDFRQRRFLSDRRKVMAFVAAASAAPFSWSANAGFSKTFLGSSSERSVLGISAFAAPPGVFSFAGQAEVDLLAVRNAAAVSRPMLTSLHAAAHARAGGAVSIGLGVSAWRPVYPLSYAVSIPDSMRDDRLWVSPSLTVRIHAGGGFSLQEHYAPRTSRDGFGREYANTVSLSLDNAAGSGVGLRVTQSLNKSSFARSTGIGASAQRSIGGVADAGVRYQYYRHNFESGGEELRTGTLGIDLGTALTGSVYLMLGGELAFGGNGDYRLYTGSLSWRF